MPPKISILIPVYNVEPYLQRCIDSVLAQDFQDWEMILVDDGSPDRCPEICDEAAKKDERITVVHKENGGLISARMAGIKEAHGEYCVFWDSDDTVPANALSILYAHISKGYDVVRASGKRITLGGEVSALETYSFQGEINGTDEYLRRQFSGDLAPYLWNAIFRTALFDEDVFKLSVDYHISYGEDWVTNLIVGLRVRRALVCNDIVYHYYYNPTSYTGASIYSLSYQKRVDEVLMKQGVLTHSAIQPMAEGKHCRDVIRSFFVPELGFSLKEYDTVRTFLKSTGGKESLYQGMDKKFLRFISCMPLYWLYSQLYCVLWKYAKLKGHQRRVIR